MIKSATQIVCALLIAGTLSVSTVEAAQVSIVHAIDGRDIGLAQELPVDVSVNGACAFKSITFKQSATVELGAGVYAVRVFPSSTIDCAGTPIIEQSILISPDNQDSSFSLVASLSDTGSAQLALFQDAGGLAVSSPGLLLRHVARAGGIQARLELRRRHAQGSTIALPLGTLNNGEELAYSVSVAQATARSTKRSYRLILNTGRVHQASERRAIIQVRGQITTARRVLYVVGSATAGFSAFSPNRANPIQFAPVCTPTPSSVATCGVIVANTATATPTVTVTATATATSVPPPVASPTSGCALPSSPCSTPTPIPNPVCTTPAAPIVPAASCIKLAEGRKANGDALPGYRCRGKDTCVPCEIICGHPSSVVNHSATGSTSIVQYNAARSRFAARMPEWPGAGTNYKPTLGRLNRACNLAGFLEHLSSDSLAWSSPKDNFLIYWDDATKRFVKANGASHGGRWAGSIRCRGLLHSSCRGSANLDWVFD